MLDHESSNPYYRQIADYFAAQIRDEVLKPGRKLPSESELCSQFSVSRVTARKAIRELEALGLVYSRQGKRNLCAAAPAGGKAPEQSQLYLRRKRARHEHDPPNCFKRRSCRRRNMKGSSFSCRRTAKSYTSSACDL